MKLKNLLSGSGTETVYKADEKFDVVILDKKECTYSYYADPMFVFMDAEYNQYEIERDDLGDAVHYIVDGMEDVCKRPSTKARSSRWNLPTIVVARGRIHRAGRTRRHLGKVMKPRALRAAATNCRCRPSSRPARRSKSTRAPASSASAREAGHPRRM